MPVHPAALDDDTLLAQCHVQRTRGSGPGGQRRNKVETGIRLTHEPTGLTAQAGERRSQVENQRIALRRLRLSLALHERRDWPGEPSALWRSRVRGGRISLNPGHADFPVMLAEALDVIEALRYDVRRAASALEVTTSQLLKLLKDEPAALEHVNAGRRERRLHPLK